MDWDKIPMHCDFGECVKLSDGKYLCGLLPDCGCAGDLMLRTYKSALEALDAEPGKVDRNAVHRTFKLETEPVLFYAVFMILDDRDLIEHGSSIRCSWLTDRGREALALMRTHWVFPAADS